jgi:hypothetical protein
MKQSIIFLAGLIFYTLSGYSQIIDFKNDKYWIDAGVGGYYSTDLTDGLAWNLSVNMINDSTLYKVRFLNLQEFQLFGPDPLEEFYSVGMMVGKGFSGKYIQVFFSGGLGVTGGIKRGKLIYTEPGQGWFDLSGPGHYEKERFILPSIPLEIDMLIKPIKNLGAGITLFGDLNWARPMYGFIFKFAIGKLR